MRKSIVTLAAAAIGAAGLTAPAPADAQVWLLPAVVAAGVGGAAIGSAATTTNPYNYDSYVAPSYTAPVEPAPAPGGTTYVRPSPRATIEGPVYAQAPTTTTTTTTVSRSREPRCRMMHEQMATGELRRVRVCD